jgi:adenylosuccinate lyase
VAPHLTPAEVDALLDPARHTGLAAEFVDRVTGSAGRPAP